MVEYKPRVSILSVYFICNISHSRRTERDVIINVHRTVCMYSAGYSCQILMKLEMSVQIFEKLRKNGISWTSV